MTGYTSSFATETIALRGYENNSIAMQSQHTLDWDLNFVPFILEPNSTIYGVAFLKQVTLDESQ